MSRKLLKGYIENYFRKTRKLSWVGLLYIEI